LSIGRLGIGGRLFCICWGSEKAGDRRQETEDRRQNKTGADGSLWITEHTSAGHSSAGQSRRVRRGRPGLTGKTVGLIAVGFPAANSLSLIFVRIGYRLNGLPYTIPDSMPGSLDCAARGLVAVGTTVARRPPHSPVLALLTHTVLTLDWGVFGVEAYGWIRLQDLDWRY